MGSIANALGEMWHGIFTPPVMAADVALDIVKRQEEERVFLDRLRGLDPVPGPNMGPWIKSYRRIRPFPETEPQPEVIFARWCWGTLARVEDRSNCWAWAAEKHRRLCVEYRWLMRQAERASGPPKGHDHPEWV
ncbi:hypothetical protein SAMN03159494_04248 [Achromobacter sp. NFACC18-2]|nr:hypothetical protein SAMN03159494_04248 [Achromobacter sp. NFACC18-2]